MKKKPHDERTTTPAVKDAAILPVEAGFAEVVGLIRDARHRAAQAVNKTLIDLYWRVGEYLHFKIEADGWSKGTVVQLAAYVAKREPGIRGFSPQNLWRMRQFFETYRHEPKLSTLLRELPWSSNLHILTRAKRPEEREVVEYALSRTLSPALIAEYHTQLPDKKLPQAKLHEFYALNAPEISAVAFADPSPHKPKGRKP